MLIVQYNFRENFRGLVQQPRSFARTMIRACSFAPGRTAGVRRYQPCIRTRCGRGWSTKSPRLLLFQGEGELALQVVQATRMRYDGRKQNPWNEPRLTCARVCSSFAPFSNS